VLSLTPNSAMHSSGVMTGHILTPYSFNVLVQSQGFYLGIL